MKAYFKILQTACRSRTTIYPAYNPSFNDNQEYWNNLFKNETNSDELTSVYFFMKKLVCCKENPTLNEFIQMKHSLINESRENKFENSQPFLNIVYKSQRVYNGFALLAKLFRSKKVVINNTDLLLNSINANSNNIIKIHQENGVYLFTIRDITGLINNSLSNNENYFALPLQIKNPYINRPFDKATLYNIFFKLRKCDCTIPILFQRYFMCNFDIKRFQNENEYFIREQAIMRDVYKSDEMYLFNNMRLMVRLHFNNRKKICENVDKQKLIKILRPYYYLYLVANYQVSGVASTNNAAHAFKRRILELFEYNPRFGRMYIKRILGKKGFNNVSDLEHPIFTMNDAINIHKEQIYSRQNSHIRFPDSESDSDLSISSENENN